MSRPVGTELVLTRLTAMASALFVVVGSAGLAAAQTCYQRPLPRVGDPWGCLSACGRSTPHRGTDFPAPTGTPVPSIADGVVRLTTYSSCLGNVLVIQHTDGMYSGYGHLSAILVGAGTPVSRGQIVARVGNTGTCTTGPHLHMTMSDHEDGWCCGGTIDSVAYIDSHTECRPDRDGDGSPEGEDCDDADPNRRPGRAESCDGSDNDCNGVVDDFSRVCGTDTGECQTGMETCREGVWGACVGEIAPVDEACDTLDNDCNGASDEERVCEHDDAALAAAVFGRTESDVDGDGRADACARTGDRFECLTSAAFGFDRALLGPTMPDDEWTQRSVYTSVRMGDVDGDGKDDLCAREDDRVVCWRATGSGFAESLVTMPLGAPSPSARSAELWLADVDGDTRADVCVRGVDGLRCRRSSDGLLMVQRALSDDAGFDDVARHGTIRFGDIDGDGRDDVCARESEGLRCWLAGASSFADRIEGPAWSDRLGWDEPRYASTLRLIDVDADGRADVCARGPDGFACWLATGQGFGEPHRGPAMRSDDGWDERSVYATIRMADLDGDGAIDLCARQTDGVRCWLWTGDEFGRAISGPTLSDATGWSAAARYSTLRLADVDGDLRADLCAHGADGLACWLSDGHGFTRMRRASAWSDASGLGGPAFASSLSMGGVRSPTTAGNPHLIGNWSCALDRHATRGAGWPWLAALLLAIAWRRRR